jgi:hypothetical protein
MRATAKLGICALVVLLYASVPILAGAPWAAPAGFHALIGGAPVAVWYVLGLLIGFPLLAWLSAGAGDDEAPKS